MGIRSADNERPKAKLSGLLGAAASRMILAVRGDEVGCVTERPRPDETYQLLWAVWGLWWGKMRRSFCPPWTIRYGSPNREIKEQRMEATFKSLDRAAKQFFTAYGLLALVNADLLPDDFVLGFLSIVAPMLIMAMAIRFHWKGWVAATSDVGLDSVSKDADERLAEKLKRWINLLLGGTFSPSQAMLRSALEAIAVTLMYLIPVYATLNFSAVQRYSADVTWQGVLLRFTFAALLTFLFVHLRKTNRIAGTIYQEELHALKPAGKPLNA